MILFINLLFCIFIQTKKDIFKYLPIIILNNIINGKSTIISFSLSFHPFHWLSLTNWFKIVFIPCGKRTFSFRNSSFHIMDIVIRLMVHKCLPKVKFHLLVGLLNSELYEKCTFFKQNKNNLCLPRIDQLLFRFWFKKLKKEGYRVILERNRYRIIFSFWGRTFERGIVSELRFWFQWDLKFFSNLFHTFTILY